MKTWPNTIMTAKGLALQTKLLAGNTLTITKAEAGAGYVSPSLLSSLTAVQNSRQTLTLSTIQYPSAGKCTVRVLLDNDELAEGYTAMQVGLYAQDPDEGEILYCIAQAAAGNGTPVPSAAELPGFGAEWLLTFQYGQADNVQVTMDPALRAAVGSPLKAATKAAMTEPDRIYVYTGSESGMTSGNWYYHDGTGWVSGGVYNSIALETDTTLSVSGAAADAKAAGEAIRSEGLVIRKDIMEEVFAERDAFSEGQIFVPFELHDGWIGGDGVYHPPHEGDNEKYTDQISVTAGENFNVEVTLAAEHAMWVGYSEYDQNGDFIRRVIIVNSATQQTYSGTVSIQDGVSSVVFLFKEWDGADFRLTKDWDIGGLLADGSVSADKLADGSVSADKLADGSVTLSKLSGDLKKETRNLFRGLWVQARYDDNGVFTPSTTDKTRAATRPDTPVTGGGTYTISFGEHTYSGSSLFYICQFDANKNRVTYTSFQYYAGKKTVTLEQNTEYLGFMVYSTGSAPDSFEDLIPEWTQVEEGSEATAFIAPVVLDSGLIDVHSLLTDGIVSGGALADGSVSADKLADSSVTFSKLSSDMKERTRNLFDSAWEQARYENDGTFTPSTTDKTRIATRPDTQVTGGETYTISFGDHAYSGVSRFYIHQFDAQKSRLKFESFFYSVGKKTLTLEANTAYLGFMVYSTGSTPDSYEDLIPAWTQVEEGDTATAYVSPFVLNNDLIDGESLAKGPMKESIAQEAAATVFSYLPSGTVRTIAHRGDDIEGPQCTAPAYILARRRGISVAENDLALSEDGQFVMWHDTTLARLGNLTDLNGYGMYTDGTGYFWVDPADSAVYTWNGTAYAPSSVPIGNLTRCAGADYGVNSAYGATGLSLDVLRRIDFGAYKGRRFAGTRILTFEEWVLLCKQLGMEIYVDKKLTYTEELLARAANIVKGCGMASHTSWLGVGGVADIRFLRTILPDARVGVLSHPTAALIETYGPVNTGRGFFFNGDAKNGMTQQAIQLGLEAGFDVEVWFVDVPASYTEEQILETIRTATSYGVTAMSLDHYRVEDAFLPWLGAY